jgi:ATP-dependent DNA helicase RecQ
VESALRVLAQYEVLRSEPESMGRVVVRLLATPERIKRELTDSLELELLRALWRAAGKQLERGAVVDLDALPPGFGGASGALRVLEALEGRQFVVVERAGGGTRLSDARRSLAQFPIDWTGLERRRRVETSKLDAMQRYAYAPGCRRQFVLKYFGDPAAGGECAGCDNCLGVKHVVEAPRLSTAVPKSGDRRTRARGAAAGGSRAVAEPGPADLMLDADQQQTFAALRALRSEIARGEQVPAYVVFPDRTLAELAVRAPRTLAAMGEIRGVGPTKLERYGARFLALLRAQGTTDAA